MEEQEEIFSPKHKQMLNLAMGAKYLAWAALFFYIIRGGTVIINYLVSAIGYVPFLNPQGMQDFLSVLKNNPYYLGDMILTILGLLLRGVIFYLVLQSVNLGLSMIVETDINYREKKNEGDIQ